MITISKLAVMLIITITVLSGCSKQDDVILDNPSEITITGSMNQKIKESPYELYVPKDNKVEFRVEYPGFKSLNKSYEQFKKETLKIEKAGTPWTDETIKQLHESMKRSPK